MIRFEKPIRTEIAWNNSDSHITFLGETEKAYLILICYTKKRGTSMVSDHKEIEKWIPKSVWDNDKNLKTDIIDGVEMTTFIPPYFLT